MFVANFLIALREGLEAALVVGILVAFLVRAGRRDLLPRLWAAVALAAALPLALGAIMTWGPYSLTYSAQEVVGGVLSLVAVAMVTWMVLWMARHAREQKSGLENSLQSALERDERGRGVTWIALLAVGRESLETAMFLWATTRSAMTTSLTTPLLGVLVGLVTAFALGWAIYAGAVRLNPAAFFRWSGLFLVVIAAGIVSYGLGDLQESGLIPGWGHWAYDFSHLVPTGGIGLALHTLAVALVNLNPNPTWLQVVGWVAYLAVVGPLFVRRAFPRFTAAPRRPTPVGASPAHTTA